MSELTDDEIIEAFVTDKANPTVMAISVLPDGFNVFEMVAYEVKILDVIRRHIEAQRKEIKELEAERRSAMSSIDNQGGR